MTDDISTHDAQADTTPTDRLLLADGGEDSEDTDEEGEADENGADEGDTTEEEETQTRLVRLGLDELSLDVLGLELALRGTALELSANQGSGNLLGNLLSTIGGLLDGSSGGLLDSVLPEGGISEYRPEIEVPSGSEVVYTVINVVLDALLDALGADTEGSDDTEESAENDEDDGDEAESEDDGEGDEADEDAEAE